MWMMELRDSGRKTRSTVTSALHIVRIRYREKRREATFVDDVGDEIVRNVARVVTDGRQCLCDAGHDERL